MSPLPILPTLRIEGTLTQLVDMSGDCEASHLLRQEWFQIFGVQAEAGLAVKKSQQRARNRNRSKTEKIIKRKKQEEKKTMSSAD